MPKESPTQSENDLIVSLEKCEESTCIEIGCKKKTARRFVKFFHRLFSFIARRF